MPSPKKRTTPNPNTPLERPSTADPDLVGAYHESQVVLPQKGAGHVGAENVATLPAWELWLLGTSASLLVTSALLVVTRSY